MSLNALVLCSDGKVMRVLRRVLSDLEIGVEDCSDADSAVRKLTRRRFEAVIVDCIDEDMASKVLSGVRSAPCNRRAIAVAMIDGQKDLRSTFALGAHFVLYKPISFERARSSFRAARALMKCERRRNARVTVEIPVVLSTERGQQQIVTSDISEGGMAVRLPRRYDQKQGPARVKFTLPGTEDVVECAAEVAWKSAGAQTGIRFVGLPYVHRDHLKSWLTRHAPEIEQNDPPVPCRLTDVSPAGCYLKMTAPFPTRTKVVLVMHMAERRFLAEGVVMVMHPEVGMGVQFLRATNEQHEHAKKFVQALRKTSGTTPEFVVEPEGIDDAGDSSSESTSPPEMEDPLLALFQRSAEFTTESFQDELRRQRASYPGKAHAASV